MANFKELFWKKFSRTANGDRLGDPINGDPIIANADTVIAYRDDEETYRDDEDIYIYMHIAMTREHGHVHAEKSFPDRIKSNQIRLYLSCTD